MLFWLCFLLFLCLLQFYFGTWFVAIFGQFFLFIFFTTFCSLALFLAIFGFAAILYVDLLLFRDWFAATFVAIFCCFAVASRIIFCCVSVQLLFFVFFSCCFWVNFAIFGLDFLLVLSFFSAVSELIPFCFGLILWYFGFIYLVIYLLFLGFDILQFLAVSVLICYYLC